MKKVFKSYTSFTRTERTGFLCLSALLIILIIVRGSMHLWVHAVNDIKKEKELIIASETFKQSQRVVKTDNDDYQDAADDNETPLPNIIDLNTADSATLVRLKGIGPVTASKIIERRKNIGPFTNVDQLLEIHHIPDATFEILKKHLIVGVSK